MDFVIKDITEKKDNTGDIPEDIKPHISEYYDLKNKYYDFLLKTQVNKVSPLKNHKRLKVQKKLIIPFSEDEVFKVIDVFSNDFEGKRNLLIVDTLYSTGIRRDELINIKLNDVFLSENLIKVLGKRNKERLVPVLGNLNKSKDSSKVIV